MYFLKEWLALISLLLAVVPSYLFSEESESLRQGALEIYPKWYSRDNVTIQGNIGVKKILQESNWITYYIKPSTTYALSHNLALHSGLGYYYTNNKTVNNVRELRPFLGLSHFANFTDKWAVSSYFRAEERFFHAMGSDDESQTTRLRFRLRNSYKFHPVFDAKSWHKLTLDMEGFKSYNSEISITPKYDYETRVTVGVERSLSEERKIRFELAWKYKTQPSSIIDASINTIYFKIQYFPSWGGRLQNKLRDRDIDE